ncbi:DUF7344 domain-containing protein [Haladaptatus salinisoli]|uniref:DUF7344 domain-containing protein n=1 Tax=Haladaptatus salinisoli TaxID=2884876 RepID=UPI001D0B308D|nr:hypothetical protein [Haladaptatus salinisoli]
MSTAQQVENQPDTTTSEPSLRLEEDQIYHLLQNERRRSILRYLKKTEGQVAMRDLAEQVAAWENNTTVQALSSNERQRAYIPLYQSHLPKLDEKGIIEYDQSRGTVQKTDAAEILYNYLEPHETKADEEANSENKDFRWEYYYLGISGISTILLIGTTFNINPFTVVPQTIANIFIVTMFGLLASFHRLV